jgi:hypothetical protein
MREFIKAGLAVGVSLIASGCAANVANVELAKISADHPKPMSCAKDFDDPGGVGGGQDAILLLRYNRDGSIASHICQNHGASEVTIPPPLPDMSAKTVRVDKHYDAQREKDPCFWYTTGAGNWYYVCY